MKKKEILSASLLVSALALAGVVLVGCNKGVSLPDQSEKVFQTNKIYYDTSVEKAYNISVKIDSTDSVSAVTCGKIKASAGQYGNRSGVLTLGADFMPKAPEKRLASFIFWPSCRRWTKFSPKA